VLALVAAWFAFQALVPLRHWLYPGDVNWTEEGHRFSWRMKLRSKEGKVKFFATNPATGETWRVRSTDYVTPRQLDEAAVRPDMILQLAHAMAADQRVKKNLPRVEIHADIRASLNGRAFQPLVDPAADLAAQPRTLAHITWITPLATELGFPGSEKRPAAPARSND
jgi:hypothetical protein